MLKKINIMVLSIIVVGLIAGCKKKSETKPLPAKKEVNVKEVEVETKEVDIKELEKLDTSKPPELPKETSVEVK